MNFPVTREIIAQLDTPVHSFAELLPVPVSNPFSGGNFRWSYPLQSAEVVQVAKAVRMVSGIRAALRLADEGFTTECCALLRIVSDFAAEILFIGEGIIAGEFNSSQQKFINDFFIPFPTDPEELAAREREYYIGRREIIAAHVRLAQRAGADSKQLALLVAYLNKGYDSYIHGAYITAMELFTGETHTFMLNGHKSSRVQAATRAGVAGKLHEVIVALALMASTRKMISLSSSLQDMLQRLEKSDEQSGGNLEALV